MTFIYYEEDFFDFLDDYMGYSELGNSYGKNGKWTEGEEDQFFNILTSKFKKLFDSFQKEQDPERIFVGFLNRFEDYKMGHLYDVFWKRKHKILNIDQI